MMALSFGSGTELFINGELVGNVVAISMPQQRLHRKKRIDKKLRRKLFSRSWLWVPPFRPRFRRQVLPISATMTYDIDPQVMIGFLQAVSASENVTKR